MKGAWSVGRRDLRQRPDGTSADALVGGGETRERAVQLAAASAGSLDRARRLADDPTLQGRRDAWWSVPDRIDGTGAAVAVLVEELRGLIDDGQKPLTARHEQEVADLAAQAEAYGNRGSRRPQTQVAGTASSPE